MRFTTIPVVIRFLSAVILIACGAGNYALAQEVIWQNVEVLPDDLTETTDAWTAVRCEDVGNQSYRIACDDFELTERTRITSITYYAVTIGESEPTGHDWYIYEFGNDGLPGDLIAGSSDEPLSREDTGWFNASLDSPIYRNTMNPDDLVLDAGRYFIAFRTAACLTNGKYSILTTRWANGNARALWNFGVLADGTVTDRWYTMDEFNGIVDQEWAFTLEGEPEETGLTLAPPVPGTVGVLNEFVATNATPGRRVYFAGSLNLGSANVPGCPGLSVDLAQPTVLGYDVSDGNGNATITRFVPRIVQDLTIYFQAVDASACDVSNLVEHVFE